MEKIVNKLKSNWIFLIIICQPILDIIAYFTFNDKITIISFLARILILLLVVLTSFFKSKNKLKLIRYLLPVFVFIILHLLNSFRLTSTINFLDLKYIIVVFQMPIITICLIDYIRNHKNCLIQIKYGVVCNVFVITLSVILSILTKSYNDTYFGYGITGWFSSANTQSMILTAIIPLFAYYYTKNSNIIRYIFANIIILLLLFYNGTKACFFTLIICYLYLIYISFFERKERYNIRCLITVFFLVFVVFAYKTSFTFLRSQEVKNNNSKVEMIIDDISNGKDNDTKFDLDISDDLLRKIKLNKKLTRTETLQVLNTSYYFRELISYFGEEQIYQQMKNDITVENITDNRLRKRVYAKVLYSQSDFITKLVGFNFQSIASYSMDLENDLTAIFYYYGYIGFSLYLGFILLFIINLVKCLIKNTKNLINPEFCLYAMLIILLLAGGEYTGAFFRKPNANIYCSLLLILVYYFNYTKQDLDQKYNKIKFLVLHLGYGGIETATINTANALKDLYDVEIVSMYNLKDNQSSLVNKKVKIKYLTNMIPNKNKFINACNHKKVISIVKEGLYAITVLASKKILMIKEILNTDNCILVSTRMEFSKLLSKYGLDNQLKIAQEHQYHNNNRKYIRTIKYDYININYLFALTKGLKKDYEKFVMNSNLKIKIRCVPNMIISDFNLISDLKNNNLISVGRLHRGKAVDELIDIFDKSNLSNYVLNIVGAGEEYSNLNNKISALASKNRIVMLGYKNQEEISNYLVNSKLFLMTSYTEGLPMVLLEAMSHGVPCIAYATDSGVCDIIKNGVNGYVISNRNEELFIKRLKYLLKNKKLLNTMSKNAIITAKKYDRDNIVKIWKRVLNEK